LATKNARRAPAPHWPPEPVRRHCAAGRTNRGTERLAGGQDSPRCEVVRHPPPSASAAHGPRPAALDKVARLQGFAAAALQHKCLVHSAPVIWALPCQVPLQQHPAALGSAPAAGKRARSASFRRCTRFWIGAASAPGGRAGWRPRRCPQAGSPERLRIHRLAPEHVPSRPVQQVGRGALPPPAGRSSSRGAASHNERCKPRGHGCPPPPERRLSKEPVPKVACRRRTAGPPKAGCTKRTVTAKLGLSPLRVRLLLASASA